MPPQVDARLIAHFRKEWENDGADGETIHLLCSEVERLQAEVDFYKKSHHRLYLERNRARDLIRTLRDAFDDREGLEIDAIDKEDWVSDIESALADEEAQ